MGKGSSGFLLPPEDGRAPLWITLTPPSVGALGIHKWVRPHRFSMCASCSGEGTAARERVFTEPRNP